MRRTSSSLRRCPGLANAACSAIDKLELPEMLGTLAGDDTCVVIMRDNASAATFCAEIREQIEV